MYVSSVQFEFLYVSALDGFISPQKKVAIAFSFDARSPSYTNNSRPLCKWARTERQKIAFDVGNSW